MDLGNVSCNLITIGSRQLYTIKDHPNIHCVLLYFCVHIASMAGCLLVVIVYFYQALVTKTTTNVQQRNYMLRKFHLVVAAKSYVVGIYVAKITKMSSHGLDLWNGK